MRKAKRSSIEEFIALPDSEKNAIYEELDSQTVEEQLARSRPLNAHERAIWAAFKKRAAQREAETDGVKKVSINVSQSLLTQADRYAKRHKLNRSELFTKSLKHLIKAS